MPDMLYVGLQEDNRIAVFAVDGDSGRLTQANGANSRSLENVLASAERPDGASGNREFEAKSLLRTLNLSIRLS